LAEEHARVAKDAAAALREAADALDVVLRLCDDARGWGTGAGTKNSGSGSGRSLGVGAPGLLPKALRGEVGDEAVDPAAGSATEAAAMGARAAAYRLRMAASTRSGSDFVAADGAARGAEAAAVSLVTAGGEG